MASFVLFASLAALLALIYTTAEWLNLAGGFGFPSDAAWARAVFARNVASGNGLCFNPGAPSAGVAGPSWIAVLSVAGFCTGRFLLSAKLLGVASVIACAVIVWYVTLAILRDWRFAFLAGLIVAGSPRLATAGLGGTEAAWAALLTIAAVNWQGAGWGSDPRQRAVAVAAVGLAALSRPELVLLVPLVLVDRWLVALIHEGGGRQIRAALTFSLPEVGALVALLAPYVVYNWQAGGPLWQQPEAVLQAQSPLMWPAEVIKGLWADNAIVLCAAAAGILVVAAAAKREHAQHRSFFALLIPVAAIAVPGLLWHHASPENAAYAAAYLTPIIAVLGASGFFLVHRAAAHRLAPGEGGARRFSLGAGIALVCGALITLAAVTHQSRWEHYGFRVKKVSNLQGVIGRWAADHLPPDASIASREVGAIGFFSRRRMIDLGGTICQEGLAYLSRPGAPDAHLLEFLQKVQPSHLAIRPGDFPDVSRRADFFTRAVTCVVTNPFSGGVTTMTLYETPWPSHSVMDVQPEATYP